MSSAVLLIAHGSRRPEANADLNIAAERLRKRLDGWIVETAYLELAEPTIPRGLERCGERGATRIHMLPYFLSAGSHVADDLRGFRDEFAQRRPELQVQLCPPIGLHPLMTEILLDRLPEAI
ncbi:MAG: CbiX/SirB N-terminal domain-containing protein [Planctomyces sp.]|nr:CbiX/SirB N-terminal domain-containing protein [Planctomyces sp.]